MIIEMNCYNGFLSTILNLKIRPATSQILKKLLLKTFEIFDRSWQF